MEFLWYIYYLFWTDISNCSDVSIVDFEQVTADWVGSVYSNTNLIWDKLPFDVKEYYFLVLCQIVISGKISGTMLLGNSPKKEKSVCMY